MKIRALLPLAAVAVLVTSPALAGTPHKDKAAKTEAAKAKKASKEAAKTTKKESKTASK